MYKKIILFAALNCSAIAGFSQTNPAVEKALNDPKRSANEAKADVYIQSKITSDTIRTVVLSEPKTNPKKRSCKRKARA